MTSHRNNAFDPDGLFPTDAVAAYDTIGEEDLDEHEQTGPKSGRAHRYADSIGGGGGGGGGYAVNRADEQIRPQEYAHGQEEEEYRTQHQAQVQGYAPYYDQTTQARHTPAPMVPAPEFDQNPFNPELSSTDPRLRATSPAGQSIF